MINPTGELLWMTPNELQGSPFDNYFIPGLLLFISIGLLSFLATIGLIIKPVWPWANVFNIYYDKHWAWTYTLYAGLALIIWIAIQIMMITFIWLQPVLILVGVWIIILIMLPPVQQFYSQQPHEKRN